MLDARPMGLWIATVIGPLAWLSDLGISYAAAPGRHAYLLATSGIAFAVALVGGVVGWCALVRMPNDVSSRLRFLAHAAIALAGIAMLLVVTTAMPTLMLTGEP